MRTFVIEKAIQSPQTRMPVPPIFCVSKNLENLRHLLTGTMVAWIESVMRKVILSALLNGEDLPVPFPLIRQDARLLALKPESFATSIAGRKSQLFRMAVALVAIAWASSVAQSEFHRKLLFTLLELHLAAVEPHHVPMPLAKPQMRNNNQYRGDTEMFCVVFDPVF